jgi:hypothetical protein
LAGLDGFQDADRLVSIAEVVDDQTHRPGASSFIDCVEKGRNPAPPNFCISAVKKETIK